MRDFAGKVAVITGAASGIGNAMASRFASEGMRLVMADIDGPALDAAVTAVQAFGAEAVGVVVDVSQIESVKELAQVALDTYGKVHVLCNNAGVLGPLAVPVWETTDNDWQWMMGVNFWSGVHGIRTFLPIMLAQDEEGHVVNTASSAGIAHSSTIYNVTKHAMVALSEYLYFNLKQMGSKIGVSVLCPGVLATNLPANNTLVRPDNLSNHDAPSELEQRRQASFAENLAQGKPPELAAGMVVDAIRNDEFWIFTDHDWDERFRVRFDSIMQRHNPDAGNVTRAR
ncbi:MAG TPA: SDR family NAD(P)-dependent oxidoreductase [Dehalococcoidia bacterium]|nr:SDR family NAD(P)-dependent oxidoreductase [Dehalococcoidia bacterium]